MNVLKNIFQICFLENSTEMNMDGCYRKCAATWIKTHRVLLTVARRNTSSVGIIWIIYLNEKGWMRIHACIPNMAFSSTLPTCCSTTLPYAVNRMFSWELPKLSVLKPFLGNTSFKFLTLFINVISAHANHYNKILQSRVYSFLEYTIVELQVTLA